MLNGNALKNFVLNKKNNLTENIVLCLAITLSSAFFYFDNYYGFMGILRVIVAVMLFIVWTWCGFLSGKNKSWGFLVFTAAYWAIPYLYMLFYSMRDNVRGYSKWLSLFKKISDLLFDKPLRMVADFAKCDTYILILALIALVVLAYIIGVNISYVVQKNADDYSETPDEEADEEEESDAADTHAEDEKSDETELFGHEETFDDAEYAEESDEN